MGYLSGCVRGLFADGFVPIEVAARGEGESYFKEMRLMGVRGIGEDELHTVICAARERQIKGACSLSRSVPCRQRGARLLGQSGLMPHYNVINPSIPFICLKRNYVKVVRKN